MDSHFGQYSSLSFASGFTGNITIKGVTQLGNNAQNFTFPSASSKLILGPGNIFNGPFTYYGHYIQLNGSTFNSIANITRYGTGNDICAGGNVFNGTTVLRDSSGHSNGFYLANVTGDTYNGDVTFIQKGTSVFITLHIVAIHHLPEILMDGTSALLLVRMEANQSCLGHLPRQFQEQGVICQFLKN